MSGERAELYFIAAMMVLILILSFAAVYFFVRQYRKERREKEARIESAAKLKERMEQGDGPSQNIG